MKFPQLLVLSALVTSSAAFAQSFNETLNRPLLDRWNYPFASSPGRESSVPIFAALGQPGFDDRDAQFLIGFDTSSGIPTGLAADRYQLQSIDVSVYISNDLVTTYDPTFDSVTTSYDAADSAYTADADAGKPIELFIVGYRNGYTDSTFSETSAFSPFSPVPPREGVRNAFPGIFDSQGSVIDISRQVRQRFEATPLAIGQTDAVQPGELLPAGTRLTFHVDLSSSNVRQYLATGLANGQVRFMVSGLHPASGGPGGGTGAATYPSFYTKESLTAQAAGWMPSLSLTVNVNPGADFNFDGGVDGADVEAFFQAWVAGDSSADFNLDGGVDGNDVEAFFEAWQGG